MITADETLEYLCQARKQMRMARDYVLGGSPFSQQQILQELEEGGTIMMLLILNHKNGMKNDGKPQS